MEEINQKINSGNIFLQLQGLSCVLEGIKGKNKSQEAIYKSEEVKLLWKAAHGDDSSLVSIAIETLVRLVSEGLLPAAATLQNFIADVSSAGCPPPFLRGITELVILSCHLQSESLSFPFTGPPTGPTHPFVLVLKRRDDLATNILEEVEYLLTHPNVKIRESSLLLIRPLIVYTCCLTENTSALFNPLLTLLLSKCSELGSDIWKLLCKIVGLIKVHSKSHLERKIAILKGLARLALKLQNNHLISAVLPCLISALPHAMKYSIPTRSIESIIYHLALQLQNGCDVTICSIADAIPFVSGRIQVTLLRIGATLLLHEDGNPLIACRLLPSLLQISSASCSAVENLQSVTLSLLSLIQSLPLRTSSNAQLSGNDFWDSLSLTFPALASYIPAIDLCNQLAKDPSNAANWLCNLSSTVQRIPKFHYSIVISMFLYQNMPPDSVLKATENLKKEVSKCEGLALEVFPMVLYRLGREENPKTRLSLLYALPSLAVNKICVAMVVKTLTTLWSCIALKPLVVRLMFDLWKVEPRTYSFLSSLIHDISTETTELQIARAFVVAEILKANPSQHVEDLLPVLSGFFNSDSKDTTPLIIIALDGITELCSAAVIDLRTTWKMIKPKLMEDKRPEVLVRLCRLLSLTPKLKVQSEKFDNFSLEVAELLWSWSASKIKNSVCEAAFKALEQFDYHEFTLKMLPLYARKGHKLPPKLASTPSEAARSPEDVLKYVPGLAWIKLAVGCPQSHLKSVESFTKTLVAREVSELPKGIYLTAIQEAKRKGYRSTGGQPEPVNYNFLPEQSILRASVLFLQDFSKLIREAETCDQSEVENLLKGLSVILVSLGQPLNRPFPALDWSFLNEISGVLQKWEANNNYVKKWSVKIRKGIFKVTAQQCNKSASALNVISKWLTPSSFCLTLQDQVYLFELMDQLGRGLNTQMLQTFLNHVFSESEKYDEQHLIKLLEALEPHLTCDYIHDNNRNAIGNVLENLNAKMNPNRISLYDAYKSCVAKLPMKHIERLTSPSLWWEVTDEKLYRAAVLRCHVAAKDQEAVALPWLNDLIDSAASLPGDRSHFVRVVSETLVARSESEETTSWFLSLLGRVRDYLKDTNTSEESNILKAHEYHQRISLYMDILVMALIIWSGIWAICSLEKLSFSPVMRDAMLPVALIALHGRPDWSNALPQFLNWFTSSFKTLQGNLANRYNIIQPMLLLASMTPKVNQVLWNKVVALLL